jgi:Na+/H+ antiporter NhaD/arsenite permease-like protein
LLVLLYVWSRRDVVSSEASRREIMSQDPAEAIKDRGLLIKAGIVLGLTVLGYRDRARITLVEPTAKCIIR